MKILSRFLFWKRLPHPQHQTHCIRLPPTSNNLMDHVSKAGFCSSLACLQWDVVRMSELWLLVSLGFLCSPYRADWFRLVSVAAGKYQLFHRWHPRSTHGHNKVFKIYVYVINVEWQLENGFDFLLHLMFMSWLSALKLWPLILWPLRVTILWLMLSWPLPPVWSCKQG